MNKIINGLACCGIAMSLVGCGSDSDDSGALVEFSLSGYEGRVVSTDTLSGTWVAVGVGVENIEAEGITSTENLVLKEYFTITGSNESGYEKTRCEYAGTENITLSPVNNEFSFGEVTGTIIDNKSITATFKQSFDDDSFSSVRTINLSAIKISDATSSIGTITADIAGAESLSIDISCYQQINGKGSGGGSSYSSQFVDTSSLQFQRYTGEFGYRSLDSSLLRFYLDTDEAGQSVSFDVNAVSDLSETVTFSGSDNSTSVTGIIQVDLPQL
jgi:hypothetical protein